MKRSSFAFNYSLLNRSFAQGLVCGKLGLSMDALFKKSIEFEEGLYNSSIDEEEARVLLSYFVITDLVQWAWHLIFFMFTSIAFGLVTKIIFRFYSENYEILGILMGLLAYASFRTTMNLIHRMITHVRIPKRYKDYLKSKSI
ncbi:MAG: hypothetical protein EOP06_02310 [Proteobacteria bacterium]|nr:MAG: hypothetical protein EOP06_02310 [Pseudomonadota bacterium]